MNRRQFVIVAASPALAQVPPPWNSQDRLNQGPFDIDQDEGWQTILFTTPSDKPLRNPGLGLVGYTWEESGPSLAVRAGRETLEQHVERLSALPFVDVLYIRCDWRNVQKRPGRLDLDPIWSLTLDAARRRGLRVAFRVQMSSPNFQPREIALPEFLRRRIPLVAIGRKNGVDYVEPRYDDPNFQDAFKELNGLLAAAFNGDPLIEWVDLMQYGFWGEGHTGDVPSPFPDYLTAERTFVKMTREQLDAWTKTPIAVNTQPDISNVGNRVVLDLALRAGAWLRTDSIWAEEPIQIDQIANRPPWCAAIFEDGEFRQYDVSKLPQDAARVNAMENRMLHALDAKANYWGLWTEAENLATYNAAYPARLREITSATRLPPSACVDLGTETIRQPRTDHRCRESRRGVRARRTVAQDHRSRRHSEPEEVPSTRATPSEAASGRPRSSSLVASSDP